MGGPPRTEGDQHDSVRQQEVVADLGRRALETSDIEGLVQEAADAIVEASRADYGIIVEPSDSDGKARLRAAAGWSDDPSRRGSVTIDDGTHLGSAVGEPTPIVANDLAEDERFDGSELPGDDEVASGISVAIGPSEAPRGVLGAYATEANSFSAHDVSFVSGVANALASGFEAGQARSRAEDDKPLPEQVVETVGDGVYALDHEDRFVLVNDAFCELSGYDREELLGAHASLVHGDEVNEKAGELAEATTPGHEEAVLEVDLRRADGTTIPIESRFVPYEYRDGRQGRTGIARDITERKQFEETLTALYDTSRELFRAGSEEEVTSLAVDAGTEVLGFTDVALYLRDEERGDLYPARKATEAGFMWDELPRIDPDDSTIAGRAYASGESVLEDDIRESPYFIGLETPMRAGVYAPVGDYGVVFAGSTTIGAFDERSRRLLELLAGTAEAAFDRLERERRVAESEHRYRTLVKNFPDGAVGLFDEELEYTAVGGELLDPIGVNPEERIGNRVSEIYPDELVDEVEPYFRAALRGEAESFEVEFHDRHLFAHTLPVRNAGGEIHAGMLVVQDVTDRRRVEAELRESEARFRMLAENLEEMVWMATPDAEEFLYVNPAFEDVWGVDRETLYEEPLSFLDRVHESDRDRVVEAFTALPDEEFDEEYRIVRPDGEVRWVHTRGARVEDEERGVDRIVGIGEDVTERVERDAELERALDLLERTERIANVGGWEIDPNTREVFWTDHIFELLEVDDEEEPPLGEALAMYHEADRPIVEDAVEDALEAGEPFDVEVRVRTEGGDTRWLRLQGVPETVEDEVISLRGAAQDVTERKRRERELERALDLLEKTERIADVAGWEIDPDTNEPYWSDHLFDLLDVSYDGQPSLDQALDVYHTAEDRATVQGAVEDALETGEPFDVEARFPRPSGDVGWLRVQGDPQLEDGEVVSLRGAVQDVTERKRREERLEELIDRLEASNERLEQFAYAASHDLQEPLRMVSSYLQLIEDRYGDTLDEEGEEFLEFAVDGAERMREMIASLLEYSRVETQGDTFEPVPLDSVVDEVLEDLHVRIEESDAEITSEPLPVVRGDGGQLRQVFQNLLDNALQYSGKGPPRVRISAERDGETWIVSVEDEGIGIDPEDADRIFDVFQRLHPREEHPGTGIGLALCQRIVERHGGEIRVDSSPGEGSTFSFTLPAADPDA